MFEELFSPGRKHTNDERKRLELTRVDLNDGDPGRGPIDLTSGKVVVRRPDRTDPQPESEPERESEPEPADSEAADSEAPENSDGPQDAAPPRD
nr:DUF6191 domain-containing protein [Streptomyces sp. SID14478]